MQGPSPAGVFWVSPSLRSNGSAAGVGVCVLSLPGKHLLLLKFRFQQARPPRVTEGGTKSPFSGRSGSGPRTQLHSQTPCKGSVSPPLPFSPGSTSQSQTRSLRRQLVPSTHPAAGWDPQQRLSPALAKAQPSRAGEVSPQAALTTRSGAGGLNSPFASCPTSRGTFLQPGPSPASAWSLTEAVPAPGGRRGQDHGRCVSSLLCDVLVLGMLLQGIARCSRPALARPRARAGSAALQTASCRIATGIARLPPASLAVPREEGTQRAGLGLTLEAPRRPGQQHPGSASSTRTP